MQDKQSTNKIFMVEPEVFFMNPQTASSNHYQVNDDSIGTDEILKQAKEEFNTLKCMPAKSAHVARSPPMASISLTR